MNNVPKNRISTAPAGAIFKKKEVLQPPDSVGPVGLEPTANGL